MSQSDLFLWHITKLDHFVIVFLSIFYSQPLSLKGNYPKRYYLQVKVSNLAGNGG